MANNILKITNKTNNNISLNGSSTSNNFLLTPHSTINLNPFEIEKDSLFLSSISNFILKSVVEVSLNFTILTATEILNLQQIIIDLEEDTTTKNISFYVSPSGSDTTGTGSQSNPFGSLDFLEYLLKKYKKIYHEIRINIFAGTYTSFPNIDLSDHQILGNGRIILDASMNTFPIIEGPYTINLFSGATPNTGLGLPIANDISTTVAPGWVLNEHCGHWVHFTSGACKGLCYAIFSNTNSTLRVSMDWYGASPGDIFEIVTCPVVFNVNKEIFIKGTQSGRTYDASYFLGITNSPNTPYLCMCGIEISSDTTVTTTLFIERIKAVMSFCKINSNWVINNVSRALCIYDSNLNEYGIPLNTFSSSSLSDVWGSQYYVKCRTGIMDYSCTSIECENSLYGNAITNGKVMVFKDCVIFSLLATNINISGSCIGYSSIDMVYIEQDGLINFPCEISGISKIQNAYFYNCYLPIILNKANLTVYWLKGGLITGNDGVLIKEGSNNINVGRLADITLSGIINSYLYYLGAIGFVNWPAVGTSTTDNAGSFVKTLA